MGIWRFAENSLSHCDKVNAGAKTCEMHVSQPMSHRRVLAVWPFGCLTVYFVDFNGCLLTTFSLLWKNNFFKFKRNSLTVIMLFTSLHKIYKFQSGSCFIFYTINKFLKIIPFLPDCFNIIVNV